MSENTVPKSNLPKSKSEDGLPLERPLQDFNNERSPMDRPFGSSSQTVYDDTLIEGCRVVSQHGREFDLDANPFFGGEKVPGEAKMDIVNVEQGIQVEPILSFLKTENMIRKFVERRKSVRCSTVEGMIDRVDSKSCAEKPKYVYYQPKDDIREFSDLQGLFSVDIETSLREKRVFWIDITHPNREDLEFCEQVFGIHPLTLEDVMLPQNREKMEIFETYVFISLQVFSEQPSQRNEIGLLEVPESSNWYIAIYPNFLISFHHSPVSYIAPVLKRLKQSSMVRPDWILYHIMDTVSGVYYSFVETCDAEVESVSEIVLLLTHKDQSDILRRIGQARRQLSVLHRCLYPKKDILTNMMNRKTILIHKKTYLYLRDILDDLLSMTQKIEYAKESLHNAQSSYVALVSLNVSKSSFELNIVMNKLTLAATICLPLTVIAGVFGMNVRIPGQVGFSPDPGSTAFSDTYWPFVIINVSMVLVAVTVFWWAKKANILVRR